MIPKDIKLTNPDTRSTNIVYYLCRGPKNNPINENVRVKTCFTLNCNVVNSEDLSANDLLGDIENCKMAALEMDLTAKQNQQCRSAKFLHLVFSLNQNENLSKDDWQYIAKQVLKCIGVDEHQAIGFVHQDTENEHLHLVINRIHPATFKANNVPFYKKKLNNLMPILEKKFALKLDNHLPNNLKAQREAKDLEAKTGQQTLFSYITEFKEALLRANSWNELHRICNLHKISLERKGQGLVFKAKLNNKEFCIKASSIDRKLSFAKLKEKLGDFKSGTSNLNSLNEGYTAKPVGFSNSKAKDLFKIFSKWKEAQIANQQKYTQIATENYKLDLARLRVAKSKVNKALKFLSKNDKVAFITQSKEFSSLFQIKKLKITHAYKKQIQLINKQFATCTFKDFLIKNKNKDYDQLTKLLLFSRNKEQQDFSNLFKLNNVIHAESIKTFTLKRHLFFFDLIKNSGKGANLYASNYSNTNSDFIKDYGNRVVVNSNPNLMTVSDALALSNFRFHQPLIINGSVQFQKQCAQMAAQMGIEIVCANPNIQQSYIKSKEFDSYVDRRTRQQLFRQRRDREFRRSYGDFAIYEQRIERIDTITKLSDIEHFSRSKSKSDFNQDHTGRIQRANSSDGNILQKMQSSDLVRKKQDSSMFLSGNEDHLMGQHGSQHSGEDVRWEVSNRSTGARESTTELTYAQYQAIFHYVTDRNKKRKQGIKDIKEHQQLTTQIGEFNFVGLRKVNNQQLVCLEQNNIVYVRVCSEYEARRLKNLGLNTKMTITSKGKLQVKKQSSKHMSR